MNKPLLLMAAAALWSLAAPAAAGPPPPGGARHVGPGYAGGAYRPIYPAYRPIYPGWGGGYWGPRAGIYIGGPAYWGGAWPYAWNAGYAWPYAATPLVINAAPAPQVFIQQEPAAMAPAEPATSYWYYCTQPAGYFPYIQDCSHAWMKVVPQQPGVTSTPPRLAP